MLQIDAILLIDESDYSYIYVVNHLWFSGKNPNVDTFCFTGSAAVEPKDLKWWYDEWEKQSHLKS